MANLLSRLRRPTTDLARYNLSDYLRQRVETLTQWGLAGYGSTMTPSGKPVESIPNSYTAYADAAYASSSVVGACMRVRRDIFRQARFTWREETDDGVGTLFRTPELDVLAKPWPNGTTGELLTRMITDVDLCGNSFIVNEGIRLRWRRPDWMYVVLSGDPTVDDDVDVVGYLYTPGGGDFEHGTAYLPSEVCHWSPIPDPQAQYRGMSWMTSALRDIQGDKAATEHKLAFFTNGATLGPIFRLPATMTKEQFKKFMEITDASHTGVRNAYKPLYVGGGAEVTLAAANFQQLELRATQGAGETRVAALAGVHPAIVGLSEGLAGSSLNAGNFSAARRLVADVTMMPLWQDACAALSTFVKIPDDAELWIRERAIPFLREDAKDAAEIFAVDAGSATQLVREGYDPKTVTPAVAQRNILLLKHTGALSVQLQEPGAGDTETTGQADQINAGIDSFLGATRARFDPAEHPRNPKGAAGGGRFRSIAQRVFDALKEWDAGGRDGDPFPDFDREPLRQVAVKRGLTFRRGASRDEIVDALKADLEKHGADVPERAPATKAAKKAAPKAPDKPSETLDSLRKLDDLEKIRDALDLKTVPQLKEMLGQEGLPKSGRKRELVDRLVEHIGGGKAEKPAGFDVANVVAALKDAKTEGEGREILARVGRNKPDLQALADLFGVEYTATDSASTLRAAILRQAVTRRLEHAAYLRLAHPVSGKTPTAGTELEDKANARLKKTQAVKAVSEVLAELDELQNSQASAKALEHRLRSTGRRGNVSPDLVDELVANSGDQSVVDRIAREHGLTRVSSAGAREPFDRKRHDPIGPQPENGTPVVVLRPGYKAVVDGEKVQLSRPKVIADVAPPKKAGRTPARPVPIRDLFVADDATIDTALRDVFEGQFGPYTTKATIGITRAGTRVDKKGRERSIDPSISIEGKIFDEQGNEIGHFSRSIAPVEMHYADGTVRRELWAHHAIVELGSGDYDEDPTKYHGTGFGREFNGRVIDWYRASGVQGIQQSDHNGYVWASQGFNFGQGGKVPDYLKQNIRQLIADLEGGQEISLATKDEYQTIPKSVLQAPDLQAQISAAEKLLERLARTEPGQPDYPTAYEISQLGRRPGQRGKTEVWLGKLLFVSADEMILNPDEGEVLS